MSFDVDYYAFLVERMAPLLTTTPLRNAPSREGQFAGKLDVLKRALVAAWPREGLILEMGVYGGMSICEIAETFPDKTVYGFDSFLGFPDDGRKDWSVEQYGVLNRGGEAPNVPTNVRLIKGFFDQTLEPFLAENPGPVGLLHIDCDIYSSTQTVLNALKGRIIPGTVIVFDEFLNYAGFENNETLAFYEFLLETNLNFEWLAGSGRVLDLTSYILNSRSGANPHKFKRWIQTGFEQEFAVKITRDGPPLKTPDTAVREIAAALLKLKPIDQPLRAKSEAVSA